MSLASVTKHMQRERRVTFNGELEFKLPDGRQEFAELVIDDSNEQLEIEHDLCV